MARPVICRGCGTKEKLPGPAPPGSLPEGWSTVSGSAHCPACSAAAPVLDTGQRISETATAAVTEACLTDPGLRAAMENIRSIQQPNSPQFVHLVRSAVEAACAAGAEALPVSIRVLLSDVLACVSWVRVAERVGRAGISAPIASADPAKTGDPFSF